MLAWNLSLFTAFLPSPITFIATKENSFSFSWCANVSIEPPCWSSLKNYATCCVLRQLWREDSDWTWISVMRRSSWSTSTRLASFCLFHSFFPCVYLVSPSNDRSVMYTQLHASQSFIARFCLGLSVVNRVFLISVSVKKAHSSLNKVIQTVFRLAELDLVLKNLAFYRLDTEKPWFARLIERFLKNLRFYLWWLLAMYSDFTIMANSLN